MRALILVAAFGIVAGQVIAAEPTKATYMITGLHCPPCTSTVQGSLSRVNGVKSVSVDWNTKKAIVQFDESVLPAQSLAAAIDRTPHMMGAGMRYAGWLAIKIPSLTDNASGQKVKDALGKIDGVRSVAIYPDRKSAAVLFTGTGTLTSQQIVDALAKDGIEATNL